MWEGVAAEGPLLLGRRSAIPLSYAGFLWGMGRDWDGNWKGKSYEKLGLLLWNAHTPLCKKPQWPTWSRRDLQDGDGAVSGMVMQTAKLACSSWNAPLKCGWPVGQR